MSDELKIALRWHQVGSEVQDLAFTLRDLVSDIFPLLPTAFESNRVKDQLLSVHHRLEALHYELADPSGEVRMMLERRLNTDFETTIDRFMEGHKHDQRGAS